MNNILHIGHATQLLSSTIVKGIWKKKYKNFLL